MAKGGWKIRAEMTGLAELKGDLAELKRGVRNRILRKALGKAARIISRAAKAKLPAKGRGREELHPTGLLRKSQGVVVRTYPNGTVAVVTGPRRGFRQQIGVTRRKRLGTPAGTPVYEDPANIGHLVEGGHAGPHPAPPHRFLQAALDETQSQAQEAIRFEVETGLEREAAKRGH